LIAIDTSALMAILLGEAKAEACIAILRTDRRLVMSAGTLAEALVVAARRGVAAEMAALIDGLGVEVQSVTPACARRIATAYTQWGKGYHPARLNYGDCFSYDAAKQNDCCLLFVGDDFSKTDLISAL
jgi:ribonuclease VapC